jgi:recombination protein RecT
MVPFENKKRNIKVATFILGYKGYIQLAIRSGQYRHITVSAIKKGELKSFNPITEEIDVQHIEDETARAAAETIGYYAMFELVNGFQKGIYWSKKKMLSHAAQYSAAFGPAPARGRFPGRVSYTDYLAGKYNKDDEWAYSSYWYKDFDGMAYKTMLRQLISKWGVMSIEMRTAFENDGAAINADGSANYFAEDEVTPDYGDDANIPEDAAPDVDDSTGEVLEGQVIIGVDDL